MTSAAVRESLARTQPERPIQAEKEAAVPFTRVPAKEAPRPRVSGAVAKYETALTANVPAGPVAAPGKKSPESEANLIASASSASTFGQAIARGLATLHG